MSTTETLLDLKVHKLSNESYAELIDPTTPSSIDDSALYLTPAPELVGANQISVTEDTENNKITFSVADGTTDQKGIVKLSDAVDSTSDAASGKTAATPAAVKIAYEKASHGHPYLSNSTKYAGASTQGGAATSAEKLNTNAGDSNTPVYFSSGVPVACTSLDLDTTGNAATATNVNWSGVTSKPNYYDAKAIKSITRNGTTFTYTCMDSTTGTFTQQDNNTTYSFGEGTTQGRYSVNGSDYKVNGLSPESSPTFSTVNTTSDKRLKENITPYTCEKSILSLPIVEFDFIKSKKHQIGCLAQDLQEICPEIVSEGDDGYLRIQESKIVYLLLEEVKKLKQEFDELKKKS